MTTARHSPPNSSSRSRRKPSPFKQALTQVARATDKTYQWMNLGLQISLVTLQLMLMAGVGSCIGAAIGFWLAYWSPVADWIQVLLYHPGLRLLGIKVTSTAAMLVFGATGGGAALALSQARTLDRYRWEWTPVWIATLGYALAWGSWQLDKIDRIDQGTTLLAVIAAAFLILGLGLVEHPLLHLIVVTAGTALSSGWINAEPLLPLLSPHADLTVNAAVFWADFRFFGLLGAIPALWLGISHFMILPSLRSLGGR